MKLYAITNKMGKMVYFKDPSYGYFSYTGPMPFAIFSKKLEARNFISDNEYDDIDYKIKTIEI